MTTGSGSESIALTGFTLSVADRKLVRSLGSISGEQAALIQQKTGLDVTGYERVLDNYGLRHALSEHGNQKREASHGQEAITACDLERISGIVSNPDTVDLVGRNGASRDVIQFTKQLDGTIYYAEEVGTGKRQLVLQTTNR